MKNVIINEVFQIYSFFINLYNVQYLIYHDSLVKKCFIFPIKIALINKLIYPESCKYFCKNLK